MCTMTAMIRPGPPTKPPGAKPRPIPQAWADVTKTKQNVQVNVQAGGEWEDLMNAESMPIIPTLGGASRVQFLPAAFYKIT